MTAGGPVFHIGKVSGISGSEAHLLLLLPALRERGWDVRFVLLHEDEPGAHDFASRLEAGGVPVAKIRHRHALDPRVAMRLWRLIGRVRPAVVHTHLVHADWHGLPAAWLRGVPIRISTKHGFNEFRESRAFGLADRVVGSRATMQIAISAGLAAYLCEREGFAPEAFEVIHYGLEVGPEPPSPPVEPRLAVVGRLIPIKGHVHLFDALAELASRSVPLAVAGDGPLRAELEQGVRARGLGEAVGFLGRVAPIARVYEEASIVVVPSLGEGFGMVALEAMERGRAVVASAVGGLPEIIADGETGILVPPGDPRALAEALRTLVADPERVRAMGAAGRVRCEELFTQERCTSATEALYRRLLERSGYREQPAPRD